MPDLHQLVDALQASPLGAFGKAGSRLFVLYLLSAAAMAFVVYRLTGAHRSKGFLSFLLPAAIWRHQSHWTDIKLFIVNHLMAMVLILQFTALATLAAVAVIAVGEAVVGSDRIGIEWTTGRFALFTLGLTLAADFSTYWVHRLHHENPVLWPFHEVHHSAEVMSPITLYRKHPLYDVISEAARALVVGLLQGVMIFAFLGPTDIVTIGGANAVYVVFNALGSNLRHSHIWISFGPVLSYLFISPAQHQIHHSIDAKHHNKNYGEVFAIWDWMFGTLYVPRRKETLRFGLADRDGNPVPQPHPDLKAALLRPFQRSAAAARRRAQAR